MYMVNEQVRLFAEFAIFNAGFTVCDTKSIIFDARFLISYQQNPDFLMIIDDVMSKQQAKRYELQTFD